MVLFQLKHGSHKGMILNLDQIIYIEPNGKTLVYVQPTPPLQLDQKDWEKMVSLLPQRAQDSGARVLGRLDLDLLETSDHD